MKKIFLLIIAFLTLVVSCQKVKPSDGVTKITYYATVELIGESSIIVQKGTPFNDPGCKAVMKGEDVSSKVVVTSNVNTAVSGVYTINYSVVNEDGFPSSTSRTITVLDPNDPIEGFYTAQSISVNGSTRYEGPHSVLLIGIGDGKYSVSDLLGGWYDQGRSYGSRYAMTGTIKVDGATVSLVSSYIAGWGDGLDPVFEGSFDAETGTLSWTTSYAGMPCIITIKKN